MRNTKSKPKSSRKHGLVKFLYVFSFVIGLSYLYITFFTFHHYRNITNPSSPSSSTSSLLSFNLEKAEEKTHDELDSEYSVLHQVISRSTLNQQTCDNRDIELGQHNKVITKKLTNITLPEFGVIDALENWVSSSSKSIPNDKNNNDWDYGMCELPPDRSCNVEGFTVIFMSHSIERLQILLRGINHVSGWKETKEVILVWNSESSLLLDEKDDENAEKIRSYNDDPNHPLRIFYSLDNGLQNNLFNRYHPKIKPKMEAIMYFDDDGPFFNYDAMISGFELWRRDSNRQVGCFPRNTRFIGEQTQIMNQKSEELQEISIQKVLDGTYHTTKLDFIPVCESSPDVADVVEYNYNVFPQFNGHMLLPSGSYLHRDFFCWLWHPAFEELRQFILSHPTHPDDMTVSAMISQLTGKAPRVFSRRVKKESQQGRRKLLWEQENWAELRNHAIRNVLGYFGSINPGSVGWCAGTEYQKSKKNRKGQLEYYCDPEVPFKDQVPWMPENEGLGHDQC